MEFYDWFGDGSVMVTELAFACCAAEFEAAAAGRARVSDPVSGRRVLVVSGTVTRAVAPALRDTAERLGNPDVVAFGACASSGGPYWDALPVVPVDAVVPVRAYVAGCAPTPAALDAALEGLR